MDLSTCTILLSSPETMPAMLPKFIFLLFFHFISFLFFPLFFLPSLHLFFSSLEWDFKN